MKPFQTLILAIPFAVGGAAPASTPAAAPDTRSIPPAPPARPKRPAPTIAELIGQFPGRWTGEQRVISPDKSVMLVRVDETYRIENPGEAPILHGDIRYSIGDGPSAKTFRGTSKTWVDAQGVGHAEVTQDGKTEKYDATARNDSLVFLPAGSGDSPASGTGVRVLMKNGVRIMEVRGFQKSGKGVFIIEGRLTETPQVPLKP